MQTLTYATVCSGIECMSVACRGLPLCPVFFSEIEPFPCAVLKAHYPNVPNLGDMSKIQVSQNGLEITNGTTRLLLDARLDILAGGTPCQDVSVAGKRAGMQEGSGTRSSLAFDFMRLARELRPRWVLWENVAGSIDSKNAPDFLRFASALGNCGYSLAWRVLDAQYVRVDGMERAVPQRRRRVWVVGCLGADESLPAQILFEPDCVAGHIAPRRRAGQGFAYTLARRDRVDAGVVGEPRCCAVRTANTHANGHGVADEATHTIDGANGQGVAYVIDQQGGKGGMNTSLCYDGYNQSAHTEVSMTLRSANGGSERNYACPKVAYGFSHSNSNTSMQTKPKEECAMTLRSAATGENATIQTIGFKAGQSANGGLGDEREVSPTLSHKPSALEPMLAQSQCELSQMRYIVRRLTPTEAERLMGLPDGYTIPRGLLITDELVAEFQRIFDTYYEIMASYSKKPTPKHRSANQVRAWLEKITDPATCPDSPRYKACGNGWATNQPRWILMRLLHFAGEGPRKKER